MASFTKRNGRWRARVRRSGLTPITKSFPTKGSWVTHKYNNELARLSPTYPQKELTKLPYPRMTLMTH